VVVEISERDPVSLPLHMEQRNPSPRTDEWAFEENDVCDSPVLHHDVHDERRIRKRRSGNGQRKNIHHLHDDYRRFVNLRVQRSITPYKR